MKYSILIHQDRIVKSGFFETTDLIDWVIIDYIVWSYFSKNGKITTFDGKRFVWLNFRAMINNLQIIKIKFKSAITKRIERLHGEGLIETYQTAEHSLYVRPTDIAISICPHKSTTVHQNDTGVVYQNNTGTVYQNDTGTVHQNDTAQYNNNQYINNQYNNKEQYINDSFSNPISFSYPSYHKKGGLTGADLDRAKEAELKKLASLTKTDNTESQDTDHVENHD